MSEEEEKRGKEKYQILLCLQFIFKTFNSIKLNTFSVHFSTSLYSKEIFPVLDDLSLNSFILDLYVNIFRHSKL